MRGGTVPVSSVGFAYFLAATAPPPPPRPPPIQTITATEGRWVQPGQPGAPQATEAELYTAMLVLTTGLSKRVSGSLSRRVDK